MTLLDNIPPGLLLILGAIVLLLLPATARKAGAIGLAALGFFAIFQLNAGDRRLGLHRQRAWRGVRR